LAMVRPTEALYYYHNDHLGTPQLLTDSTGTVSWKAVFTPFGEAVLSLETVENPFRFPGQYYDQETGLHYNWNRYYDPKTGRYLTPDPIGLEGRINLFIYAMDNPLMFLDVSGVTVEKCCGMTSDMPGEDVMTGLECMSKCLKTTIYISSGWRNDPDESYHNYGLVADVNTNSKIYPSKIQIRQAARQCGFYVWRHNYPTWVHVDLRDNREPRETPEECACKKIREDY
jgi:RHS repeat-associated protein